MDFFAYLDRAFDQSLHLTEAEGNYLRQQATDEELEAMVGFYPTFSDKRKTAATARKYREQYAALSAEEKQQVNEAIRLATEARDRSVAEGLQKLPEFLSEKYPSPSLASGPQWN